MMISGDLAVAILTGVTTRLRPEGRGRTLKAFTTKFDLTICSPFDNTFVCENGGSVIYPLLIQGNISSNIFLLNGWTKEQSYSQEHRVEEITQFSTASN